MRAAKTQRCSGRPEHRSVLAARIGWANVVELLLQADGRWCGSLPIECGELLEERHNITPRERNMSKASWCAICTSLARAVLACESGESCSPPPSGVKPEVGTVYAYSPPFQEDAAAIRSMKGVH